MCHNSFNPHTHFTTEGNEKVRLTTCDITKGASGRAKIEIQAPGLYFSLASETVFLISMGYRKTINNMNSKCQMFGRTVNSTEIKEGLFSVLHIHESAL